MKNFKDIKHGMIVDAEESNRRQRRTDEEKYRLRRRDEEEAARVGRRKAGAAQRMKKRRDEKELEREVDSLHVGEPYDHWLERKRTEHALRETRMGMRGLATEASCKRNPIMIHKRGSSSTWLKVMAQAC